MIVNGVDLVKKYGLIVQSRDIQACKIVNYLDWLESSSLPIKTKDETISFTTINIKVLIEGENESETLMKLSNLINDLKSGVMKFSDLDFYYNFALDDHIEKLVYNKAYTVTLYFKCDYKFKDEVKEVMNRVISKTINVEGNTTIPAIVEIIPSVEIIDLTINGLSSDPIVIKNTLKANKKIILNGENDTVTVDGVNYYSNVDMWDFPKLKPGSNTITVSRNNVDITIKYKPRFI